MGVNGGSGNLITFQQLQDFYGGAHPISLSEYYRGGALVPSSVVNVVSNGAVSQALSARGISLSGNQAGVSISDNGSNDFTSYVEIRVRPSSSGSASYSGPSSYFSNDSITFAGNSSFALGGSGSFSLSANTDYTMVVDFVGFNDLSQAGANFSWSGLGEVTYTAVTRAVTSDVNSGTTNVNTSIPTSGQISMNQFNSPGTPSP